MPSAVATNAQSPRPAILKVGGGGRQGAASRLADRYERGTVWVAVQGSAWARDPYDQGQDPLKARKKWRRAGALRGRSLASGHWRPSPRSLNHRTPPSRKGTVAACRFSHREIAEFGRSTAPSRRARLKMFLGSGRPPFCLPQQEGVNESASERPARALKQSRRRPFQSIAKQESTSDSQLR